MSVSFGALVRQEREGRRWSQEKLGLMVGVDQTAISQIERGKFKATHELVIALAKALDLDPAECVRLAGYTVTGTRLPIDPEGEGMEERIWRGVWTHPLLSAQLRRAMQIEDDELRQRIFDRAYTMMAESLKYDVDSSTKQVNGLAPAGALN